MKQFNNETRARLEMHDEKLVNMELELATLAKSLQFLKDSVRSRQSLHETHETNQARDEDWVIFKTFE